MSDVIISSMQSSIIANLELPIEYSKLLRRADDFTLPRETSLAR